MSAVLDSPVKPEARQYVAGFARDAGEPDWLAARRQQAIARFAETGFPSRRGEGWRYLDLRSLEQRPLLPAAPSAAPHEGLRGRLAPLTLGTPGLRLVLVDGRFAPALSTIAAPAGTWFGPLAQALRERPQLVRQAVEPEGDAAHPFAALNAALFADGYLLQIEAGVALDEPVEIVHLASGAAERSFHTRSLIALGPGSRAGVIEVHAGQGRYWRNDVTAARLAAGAELNRVVLIEEGSEAVHLGQFDATVAAAATFAGFALLLGGRTVRHEANVALAGDNARCEIDGAFVVGSGQEVNVVTAIDHAAPGGQTRELVKGVAAGRGHGAFQGRITVRPDAQKTDAHQLSRNLLIGERAVIDTKPELEIFADDVKCSHGASVGDLDENALFYLASRGIPPAEARHMLIDGFVREAVEGVREFAVRDLLLRRLTARLASLEE